MDWLHALPPRPWDADGPISARTIARLLKPFAVRPRGQRIGPANPARGYQLEAFLDLWKSHLSLEIPSSPTASQQSEIVHKDATCNTIGHEVPDTKPATSEQPQAPKQNNQVPKKGSAATSQKLEAGSPIVNKDAACNTIGAEAPAAQPVTSEQPSNSNYPITKLPSYQLPTIVNKDATCNTIAHDVSVARPAVSKGSQAPSPNGQAPDKELEASSQKLEAASTPANKDAPCNTIAREVPDAQPVTSAQPSNSNYPLTKLPNYQLHDLPPNYGFLRLTRLHSDLRLQGICPPLDGLANMYPPGVLKAALDWVDAHPEWSSQYRYKPALEFVAAFQNGPMCLYDPRSGPPRWS
jgi:hypothetical protein